MAGDNAGSARIAVTNPSATEEMSVTFELMAGGRAETVVPALRETIQPRQTRVFENIGQSRFGVTQRGVLRIRTSTPAVISTRLSDETPAAARHTVAARFDGVPSGSGIGRGRGASLSGLGVTPGNRYFISLIETSGHEAQASVQLRDEQGDVVATSPIDLAPYDVQVVDAASLFRDRKLAEGSIHLGIEGEGQVVGAGSLVSSNGRELAAFEMMVDDVPTALVTPPAEEEMAILRRSEAQIQEKMAQSASRRSAGAPAALARPKIVSNAIMPGDVQLMATTGSTMINARSTGDAEYLFLGRVNSSTMPGYVGSYINNLTHGLRVDGGVLAGGDLGVGVIPATGAGYRMMWYPYKAAFRAGGTDDGGTGNYWDDANTGFYSWAGGNETVAKAFATFAFGDQTQVTGVDAAGFGGSNTVSGTAGFTAGASNIVNGFTGVALGYINRAQGQGSVAIGYRVASCDDYGVAIGHRVSTSSAPTSTDECAGTPHTGSMMFGDESTNTHMGSIANNEFAVRAAGGFRFRTNSTLTTGCNLAAGSGVFSCASSRTFKTGFAPLEGEDVLSKLATMPVGTWSFIGEPAVRHAGPVAEDFRAAFGLGEDDKSIGHTDMSGIALKAAQALEARTRKLQEEIDARDEIIRQLQQRMEDLEKRER
jgi:hypothetical protein